VIRGQEPLDISPDYTVLVIGAGPIGLMHTALAKEKGARRLVVAGRGSDRLAAAMAFGADRVVDVDQYDLAADVKTGGRGFDVVIVAASAPAAITQALELAAVRGRVSWFAGLPKDASRVAVDANLVHYKELRVTGTTACSTADCRKAAGLVNSGRLDLSPLVTHRLSLEAAPGVFAAGNDRSMLKTVLEAAAG
jgi:threonine dehydrogenase-like Zn-dependent dehydrogenase